MLRRVRIAVILIIGLVLLLALEPHLLRFSLKHWVIYKAKQHGNVLTIEQVKGSLFEPITFHRLTLNAVRGGVSTESRIETAEAQLDWKAAVLHRGNGFLKQLTFRGFNSTVTFTGKGAPKEEKSASEKWNIPKPTRFVLEEGDLSVKMGKEWATFSGLSFTIGTRERGEVHVKTVTTSAPEEAFQIFKNLKGTTAMQGTRLLLADISVAPNLFLKSLSSDLENLNRGELKVSFEFAAFDGAIRGELVNIPREARPHYEISGSFSQIAIAPLAAFLEVNHPANGTIKEGKFTFRGSPHALDRAVFSTRLESNDFVWGRRQWNSLIVGATIVNRRIQIPEFYLQQDENTLQLKGELLLPVAPRPWWESEFNFDVEARIEKLGELTALLGPAFADVSGKLTIDGAIKGNNKAYSGQLILSGSDLTYRTTPFDSLNAGIKLTGNEVRLINLELTNGRDFIRGRGLVNILGEKHYWGELKASIGQLAQYKDLQQKPITPTPLEGNVFLEWSGGGTLTEHSGAFTATCKKLFTPGTAEIPATLPIDAVFEGTYTPGSLSLSQIRLAHDKTQLEARLNAIGNSLKIEGIRLTQKNLLWLEGSADLPINLSQWWQAPGLTAIDADAPLSVKIEAKNVELQEAAQLAGRPSPFKGKASANIDISGSLRAMQMSGPFTLKNGKFEATPRSPALDQLDLAGDLEGKIVRLSSLKAKVMEGTIESSGRIDFTNFDQPALELTLRGKQILFTAGEAWAGRANIEANLTGPGTLPQLSGSAQITAVTKAPTPNFSLFLKEGNGSDLSIPPPQVETFLPRWRYDLTAVTPSPLKWEKGTLSMDFLFSGEGENLKPIGTVSYQKLPFKVDNHASSVEEATFSWDRTSATPHLTAKIFSPRSFSEGSPGNEYRFYVGLLDQLASTTLHEKEMQPVQLRYRDEAEAPGLDLNAPNGAILFQRTEEVPPTDTSVEEKPGQPDPASPPRENVP